MIDYAARRFREEVTEWPDGVYEADAYVDHDPLGHPDVHLHVKVTVAGDTLTIDFTGSDSRPEIQAWSTYGNTRGYTVGQIAAMMDPEIPKNEGFFEQINLVVPKGCVLNPDSGRPVSAGTHHPGADVGEVIAVAMQHVLPERAVRRRRTRPASRRSSPASTRAPARRSPTTPPRCTQAGATRRWGWTPGRTHASFGNLWKATAEINESLYPHVQWSRDYRTDSGGEGQWRGICGSHYEKEVTVDAKVYTYVVGMKYPMPGICGGENGAAERDDPPVRLRRPVPRRRHRRLGPDGRGRARDVQLRRWRWLGRSTRPRSASRARRRDRRVRLGRRRRARLRRRAHGLTQELTLAIDDGATEEQVRRPGASRFPEPWDIASESTSAAPSPTSSVSHPPARSSSTRRPRRSTTSRAA